MTLTWQADAWEDYLYWQNTDKKTLKRLNQLIQAIQRDPFHGIGKPEALKSNLQGFYSRRINDEHRIVYTIVENSIVIAQCRYHY